MQARPQPERSQAARRAAWDALWQLLLTPKPRPEDPEQEEAAAEETTAAQETGRDEAAPRPS